MNVACMKKLVNMTIIEQEIKIKTLFCDWWIVLEANNHRNIMNVT